MTPAEILGHARASLELGQQYARLAPTQPIVLIPADDKDAPSTEVATEAAAIHHLLRARAEIDRAIRGMRR